MASTAVHFTGRGAQSISFKTMLRKSYHRKVNSPAKLDGEEVKSAAPAGNGDGSWWIPDERTGIFHPKGKEKVIQDVPPGAGKGFQLINWLD